MIEPGSKRLNGTNGQAEEKQDGPYNIEAEQALLGAVLIRNEVIYEVLDFLEPDHFFDELHKHIYATLSKVIVAGRPASPITLKTFYETAEPIDKALSVPQ